MRIALVGAELEENLALRYIHAAVAAAGHDARIFDFHAADQTGELVAEIARYGPAVVGLSMVFTARAGEFVELARALRRAGSAAHVTAGGHFASFNAEALLRDAPALDSVLHGEGEEALVDLAAHLHDLPAVLGATFRAADGSIRTTLPRPPVDDLDSRPRPTRPQELHDYLGQPICNILSGRGCFGSCAFCSISAWHRKIGGRRFRQRSVDALVAEMADLYHGCGVRIFNFHDDNFFGPRVADNLRRFSRLKAGLDAAGVGRIGIQVKARPDSIDEPIVAALKELGLFRVFLGVESNAVAGLKALGRGINREQNETALAAIQAADVHVTFNLLMFEPDCSMDDLRDNIAFTRRHADCPQNFCGVVVYSGTPLEARLREQGRLKGDYWGYRYDIADPACRTAYEIFRTVFTPRNFFLDGMNLQAMAVDYNLHIAKHFYARRVGAPLVRQAKGFIRDLNANNAELLEAICDFAADLADPAAVDAFTADMVDRRADFDAAMADRAVRVLAAIRAAAERSAGGPKGLRPAAAAAGILMVAAGGGLTGTHGCEMAPNHQAQAAAADVEGAPTNVIGTDMTELVPAPPGTWPTEPVHEPPATRPAGTHSREMAPAPPTPTTAPATQPTTAPTSRPATQPADPDGLLNVRPYSAAQTKSIQAYLQARHSAALIQLANAHLKGPTKVRIRLALSKDGRPVMFRIELTGKQYDAFVRALRKQILNWRVPKLTRAGSCTVTLQADRSIKNWHMTEMAPRD